MTIATCSLTVNIYWYGHKVDVLIICMCRSSTISEVFINTCTAMTDMTDTHNFCGCSGKVHIPYMGLRFHKSFKNSVFALKFVCHLKEII